MSLDLIQNFKTQDLLEVTRHDDGQWVGGRYLKGTPDIFEITASVQPLSPNEILQLPEHRRTRETIKIYTDFRLRTSNEANQEAADVVEYDGKLFEIHSVWNWNMAIAFPNSNVDLPHFKAIGVKIDGQGRGSAALND